MKKNTLIIPKTFTLHQAVLALEENHEGIVIVVDDNGKVVGILTDPDIRRLVLRGVDFKNECAKHINSCFSYWTVDRPIEGAISFMRRRRIRQIPILDCEGKLVDIFSLDSVDYSKNKKNEVVIMAGGLGKRLRPYTDNCPKPMLPVNGKPILEHIIEKFLECGFHTFHICVNYLSDQIEDYFKSGDQMGVKISYIREKKRLGTAGALSLIKDLPTQPFIVVNGDILSDVDYSRIIEFHRENNAIATVGVRKYEYQIPFGVIDTRENEIIDIKEKPIYSWFVNAGIYCLNSVACDSLSPNKYCDMPELFRRLRQKGSKTVAFGLHEEWVDIGRHEDLEKVRKM